MNAMFHNPELLVRQAKWAFSTRRVCRSDAMSLVTNLDEARPGDLVLGRIESIGSHKRLQLAEGRPSQLYPGDLVVLACGTRYASDQFEGVADLNHAGADMLAGGGCIGTARQRHDAMKPPTRVRPLGLITGDLGRVLNLADYALPVFGTTHRGLTVIGVVGAAMNAGKTTATAALVHGVAAAGHRTAALKATGTGAFGDVQAYADAGAHCVADFTDCGLVSTYQVGTDELVGVLDHLLRHAAELGCDVAVVEFADGVLQQETAALLSDPRVRDMVDGWAYACGDPLAAIGGLAVLDRFGITPLVLTGLVSASPLAAKEAELETGLIPTPRDTLADPAFANAVLLELRSASPSVQA